MKYKKIVLSFIILIFSSIAIAGQKNSTDHGVALYRAANYDAAVKVLRDIVTNDKHDKIAWLYLGASFVKLGKNKEAVNAFDSSNFTYKDENSYDNLYKTLKIVERPRAAYTDSARQNNVTGTIKIAVEYGSDGKIGFVFLFQKLPDGLTENAIRAAKSIRFEPAMKDGKPVTVVSIVTYSFSIY